MCKINLFRFHHSYCLLSNCILCLSKYKVVLILRNIFLFKNRISNLFLFFYLKWSNAIQSLKKTHAFLFSDLIIFFQLQQHQPNPSVQQCLLYYTPRESLILSDSTYKCTKENRFRVQMRIILFYFIGGPWVTLRLCCPGYRATSSISKATTSHP